MLFRSQIVAEIVRRLDTKYNGVFVRPSLYVLRRTNMPAVLVELAYISNEEDAKDVFGIEAANSDITGGKLDRDGYVSVAEQLTKRFGFRGVAITLRECMSASDNDWSGMLYTNGKAVFSKKYSMHIIDRVGGGDSFGAGLIYALMNGYKPQDAIEFSIAASCLKHSIEGDYNLATVQEVQTLAGGDASGRVQR